MSIRLSPTATGAPTLADMRINHVGVDARDLRESVAFYVELLAARPTPAPNFGDPAENLDQVDAPGLARLPEDVRAPVKGLWELNPQTGENMSARLFVPA